MALRSEQETVAQLMEQLAQSHQSKLAVEARTQLLESRLARELQRARSLSDRLHSVQKRMVGDGAEAHCARRPLTYAVYRVLYGGEFLAESVASVAGFVDKVFIFWTNQTWADVDGAQYGGQYRRIARPVDNVREVAERLAQPNRVIVQYDHVRNNTNQVTHLVNDRIIGGGHAKPELLVFLEWDHVWRADQLRGALQQFSASSAVAASSRVFECYRSPRYFTVERPWRWGTVFWNLTTLTRMPRTGKHANPPGGMPFVDAYVHNMGLCMHPRLMWQKFLIALAFSEKIADSPPDPRWFEQRWLHFDAYNSSNFGLEMAAGFENDMLFAYEYNAAELPPPIATRLHSTEHWQSDAAPHDDGDDDEAARVLRESRFDAYRQRASPSLQAVVRRYYGVHRRILRHMDAGDHQMSGRLDRAGATRRHRDPIRTRLVIFRNWPEAGLGNRLQALTSAFLFALLTDRALLVDWPQTDAVAHFNKEETVAMVPLAELFAEPGFDWTYTPRRELQLARNYTHSDVAYDGHLGLRGTEELFQCADYNAVFVETDVVHVRADQFFALYMACNALYRPLIERWFGAERYDMYTPLARLLFHPAADVQRVIDSLRGAGGASGRHSIGLQIRRVGASKLNDAQEEVLWNCAEALERAGSASGNGSTAVARWFLATDSEQTRALARRRYGDKVHMYDVPISRQDAAGLKSAIVDLWMLASCPHALIVSAASTFGRVAAGLRGTTDNLMYVNRAGVCEARDNWQPCLFKRQYASCMTVAARAALPDALNELLEIDCDMT